MRTGSMSLAVALVLAALGSPGRAQSRTWPQKPVSIVVSQEVARALGGADGVAALARHGAEPRGNTLDEFAAMIAADVAFGREAVGIAGLQRK